MLSDFDDITEELSIVNGSLVPLGNGFTFYGRSIIIRDTMLLAQAASKSLANIGKLYGNELNKIIISKNEIDEIEDMENFLLANKTKLNICL